MAKCRFTRNATKEIQPPSSNPLSLSPQNIVIWLFQLNCERLFSDHGYARIVADSYVGSGSRGAGTPMAISSYQFNLCVDKLSESTDFQCVRRTQYKILSSHARGHGRKKREAAAEKTGQQKGFAARGRPALWLSRATC